MPPDENWRDILSDETKGNPALANFTDVQQMADSFLEMKSFQGRSIVIPGTDAGDEAQAKFIESLMDKAPNVMLKPDFDNAEQSNEFYTTMGKPKTADEYKTPEFEFPEGEKINEDKVAAVKKLAHDIGLNQSQYEKFISTMTEQDIVTLNEGHENQKNSMKELNKEWGDATKERIEAALSIAERTHAPQEIIDQIKSNTLPMEAMKWIHSLSVSIGDEGNQLGDLPHNQTGTMTPAEAQESIDAIYANKQHAFHNGNPAAMVRMVELVGIANPGMSKDVGAIRAGT